MAPLGVSSNSNSRPQIGGIPRAISQGGPRQLPSPPPPSAPPSPTKSPPQKSPRPTAAVVPPVTWPSKSQRSAPQVGGIPRPISQSWGPQPPQVDIGPLPSPSRSAARIGAVVRPISQHAREQAPTLSLEGCLPPPIQRPPWIVAVPRPIPQSRPSPPSWMAPLRTEDHPPPQAPPQSQLREKPQLPGPRIGLPTPPTTPSRQLSQEPGVRVPTAGAVAPMLTSWGKQDSSYPQPKSEYWTGEAGLGTRHQNSIGFLGSRSPSIPAPTIASSPAIPYFRRFPGTVESGASIIAAASPPPASISGGGNSRATHASDEAFATRGLAGSISTTALSKEHKAAISSNSANSPNLRHQITVIHGRDTSPLIPSQNSVHSQVSPRNTGSPLMSNRSTPSLRGDRWGEIAAKGILVRDGWTPPISAPSKRVGSSSPKTPSQSIGPLSTHQKQNVVPPPVQPVFSIPSAPSKITASPPALSPPSQRVPEILGRSLSSEPPRPSGNSALHPGQPQQGTEVPPPPRSVGKPPQPKSQPGVQMPPQVSPPTAPQKTAPPPQGAPNPSLQHAIKPPVLSRSGGQIPSPPTSSRSSTLSPLGVSLSGGIDTKPPSVLSQIPKLPTAQTSPAPKGTSLVTPPPPPMASQAVKDSPARPPTKNTPTPLQKAAPPPTNRTPTAGISIAALSPPQAPPAPMERILKPPQSPVPKLSPPELIKSIPPSLAPPPVMPSKSASPLRSVIDIAPPPAIAVGRVNPPKGATSTPTNPPAPQTPGLPPAPSKGTSTPIPARTSLPPQLPSPPKSTPAPALAPVNSLPQPPPPPPKGAAFSQAPAPAPVNSLPQASSPPKSAAFSPRGPPVPPASQVPSPPPTPPKSMVTLTPARMSPPQPPFPPKSIVLTPAKPPASQVPTLPPNSTATPGVILPPRPPLLPANASPPLAAALQSPRVPTFPPQRNTALTPPTSTTAPMLQRPGVPTPLPMPPKNLGLPPVITTPGLPSQSRWPMEPKLTKQPPQPPQPPKSANYVPSQAPTPPHNSGPVIPRRNVAPTPAPQSSPKGVTPLPSPPSSQRFPPVPTLSRRRSQLGLRGGGSPTLPPSPQESDYEPIPRKVKTRQPLPSSMRDVPTPISPLSAASITSQSPPMPTPPRLQTQNMKPLQMPPASNSDINVGLGIGIGGSTSTGHQYDTIVTARSTKSSISTERESNGSTASAITDFSGSSLIFKAGTAREAVDSSTWRLPHLSPVRSTHAQPIIGASLSISQHTVKSSHKEISTHSQISTRSSWVHLFTVDKGTTIRTKTMKSKFWTSFEQQENNLRISNDPILISHTPRRAHAFIVTSNPTNKIWYKEFTGSSWSSFREIGGAAAYPPSVVSLGYNRIDLFYTGDPALEDNYIYHSVLLGSSSWSPSDFQRLNIMAIGPPVAIPRHGTKIIDLFYVDRHQSLFHKSMSQDGWTATEDLGGPSITTPAAVSWCPDRLDVFVVHFDNALYHKSWDGTKWRYYFEKLGGVFDAAPAVASWGEGRIDVFAVDVDGALLHKWWDNKVGAWLPEKLKFEQLGTGFVGTPTVLTDGPDSLDVFVVGKADAHIYHGCWNARKWSRFEDVGGYSEGCVAAVLC